MMLATQQARPLSPTEKIDALRNHLAGQWADQDDFWPVVFWLAFLALATATTTLVVSATKRRRALTELRTQLRRLGLASDERTLLEELAALVPRRTVPLLLTHRPRFDQAAAQLLRHAPDSAGHQRLTSLLSLRERLPFHATGQGASLNPGDPLSIRRARPGFSPMEARVLQVNRGTVQVGVVQPVGDLPSGERMLLTLHLDSGHFQAPVRVRGKGRGADGRTQLLLDRPWFLLPQRQTDDLTPCERSVQVELLERFPRDLKTEGTPIVSGTLTDVHPRGVMLQMTRPRLRDGESVRVQEEQETEQYHCFAEIAGRHQPPRYFLIRNTPGPDQTAPEVPIAP